MEQYKYEKAFLKSLNLDYRLADFSGSETLHLLLKYKAYLIEQAKKGKLTAQQVLDKYDLHWTYAPNGDHTKPFLHDSKCAFCDVEDRVLEAMSEHANQFIPAAPAEQWISVNELEKAVFWSKVKDNGRCWNWTGSLDSNGYGRFRLKDKQFLSHRLSFLLINGGVNSDVQVLHKCDNPKCVNPDHLFLGDHKLNMADKASKGRSRMVGRSSYFYGIGWRNDSKKWRAYIFVNGKNKSIGSFKTEKEACIARDSYITTNKTDDRLSNWMPLPAAPESATSTKQP